MPDPTSGPDHDRQDRDRPGAPSSRGSRAVITNARSSTSEELGQRVRRYTITMAFRTACFLSMLFVHGWARWALLGCAVFLPYVAVVLANQSDQRSRADPVEQGAPLDAPQLTTGAPVDLVPGEIIEGSVIENGGLDGEPEGRVA